MYRCDIYFFSVLHEKQIYHYSRCVKRVYILSQTGISDQLALLIFVDWNPAEEKLSEILKYLLKL